MDDVRDDSQDVEIEELEAQYAGLSAQVQTLAAVLVRGWIPWASVTFAMLLMTVASVFTVHKVLDYIDDIPLEPANPAPAPLTPSFIHEAALLPEVVVPDHTFVPAHLRPYDGSCSAAGGNTQSGLEHVAMCVLGKVRVYWEDVGSDVGICPYVWLDTHGHRQDPPNDSECVGLVLRNGPAPFAARVSWFISFPGFDPSTDGDVLVEINKAMAAIPLLYHTYGVVTDASGQTRMAFQNDPAHKWGGGFPAGNMVGVNGFASNGTWLMCPVDKSINGHCGSATVGDGDNDLPGFDACKLANPPPSCGAAGYSGSSPQPASVVIHHPDGVVVVEASDPPSVARPVPMSEADLAAVLDDAVTWIESAE